jgi:hypothetical protein
MIGKGVWALTVMLALSACAEPKYVSREGVVPTAKNSEAARSFRFPGSGLSAWIEWEKKPTEEDFGSFLVKIGRPNRADGSPLPIEAGDELQVVLWMPSMGHGSSPVGVEKVDTGTFRASDVFFTMPGDWEIRVKRVSAEFGQEEAALAIRI